MLAQNPMCARTRAKSRSRAISRAATTLLLKIRSFENAQAHAHGRKAVHGAILRWCRSERQACQAYDEGTRRQYHRPSFYNCPRLKSVVGRIGVTNAFKLHTLHSVLVAVTF